MVKRIAVSTGGGDAPGLNAVIRAVVKAATSRGWEVYGVADGFEGFFSDDRGIRRLTKEDVRGILPRGGTILGTTNRGNPFAYRVPDGSGYQEIDRSAEVVDGVRRRGLEAVITIGGDGTLRIALELGRLGVPVVGVPKTIDNDLCGTETTFGFDTALVTATEAIDKLHTTAESHHRVMVVEVMGRHAGWIALHAGIGGGADIILIPEIPFTTAAIARDIQKRSQAGRAFSIVVVAEGAAPQGGDAMYQDSTSDPLAPVRLGGIGAWLAADLGRRVEHEVRATVLGHLQRGGSPSARDRILASAFGVKAVELVEEGRFGEMVALRCDEVISIPLGEAVAEQKCVPITGQLVRTARGLGISFGDG